MAGTDIAVNCAGGLAVEIVKAVGRQARYCYDFNELVTDLSDEQRNLKLTRDGIQCQIGEDKANTKEPLGDLQLQLKAANELIDKVEELKRKAKENGRCCNEVCPNWICRFFVGKKAEKKKEAMKQLNGLLRQKLLSARRLPLRALSSEDFTLFKCTQEARSEILRALRDDEKIRIGLCGMGGCGKTSLIREVHKELQDSNLYKTAFAVVSYTPNFKAIQDSIANWIGLKFETEKNEQDRAARLSMSFQTGERYLVILDDVWQVLDFKAIGIPVGENCKVILSSRKQHILELMKFEAVIYMSLLTKEEAWELFQRHAGEIKEPLQQVAQEISDECHRLPVAIKAVASTLRGKELFAWKEALATLKDRRQPLNIEKGLENPYRCLKFSFDELKDPEELSLFLLCALFPFDSPIAIEVLIRFAFGLGIFLEIDSYQRARSKVRTTVDKFKDYCLLLHEGQHVKLHNMCRALALCEAKKKTRVISKRTQIVALEKSDYLKDTIRLFCQGIEEFPDHLNCPELEILIISNNGGFSSNFSNMFFEKMTKLQVLDIKNTSIGTKPNLSLPQSMDGLKKLRTLCLRGWTLIDISIFEKLEMLNTMELLDCEIKELPKELANLKALKLLQAAGCIIGGNPYEVLAICSQLEELYFVGNHLPEMEQIDQNVPKFFRQIGSFKELQSYHIEIGVSINTSKDDSTSKLISISSFDSSISNETFQELPQTLEVLLFEKVQGHYKSIIPDMFPIQGECLNELKEFVLRDSDCIKYLIDTTNDQLYQTRILFAKLQKLKVEAIKCLEALCHGPPPSGLFEKLKDLVITNCSKLTSLFTTTTAQKLGRLEVLEVMDCGKLKCMIKVENGHENIPVGPVLPNLKQISVKRCKNLKFVLPISFASDLLQLETLEIEDAARLRYIFGNDNHDKDQNQNHISIGLPAVKIVKLINLPVILSICPQDYHVKLPSRVVESVRCPWLSRISDIYSVVKDQDGNEAMKQAQLLSMTGGDDFTDGIAGEPDSSPRKDHFHSLVRSLNKEKLKLEAKIKELEANAVEPSGNSQQQLKEARDIILKVEKLEEKAKISKGYSSWVCPKWINLYNEGKRFARMTEELKQFNKRLASVSVPYSSSGAFIFFKSRRMAYEHLLSAVEDNKINMIGLCGMGGCGKTFLALEICKVAENRKLFDKVIFVSLSGDPNITTIQNEIASGVGLGFSSNENKVEKAARLYKKLSSGKKFLIVLDDIWNVLKLEDIGIPFGKNCKLILTTAERHICTMMNCQEEIYLSLLTEEEAWALFQRHAVVEENTVKDLSLEFAKQCLGLPITIVSVARSLKHIPEVKWKEALEKLKGKYASDVDDITESPLKCLRLCIEYLVSGELRSLLVLFAHFPKYLNNTPKLLIKFAFGLGIFEDVYSYEEARSKFRASICTLKDSGLLLAEEGQYIHMHDLVRSAAKWVEHETHVTMSAQDAFLGKNDGEVTRLYCYNIYEFRYKLNLPKLEIFFVTNFCKYSPKFAGQFFDEMIELKVLAIINTYMQTLFSLVLPQSIYGLKNLRTLWLNGWILGNISVLGELKMIETIELSYCVIEELPNELAKLKKLRSLEVSCSSIGHDPFKVLAECSHLEELYFIRNDLHQMVSDVHVVQLLRKIISSEVLQRYHLDIGISKFILENDLISKVISLNNFNLDALPSETIKNILAQKLEVFYLEDIKGHFHNIIPDIVPAEGEYMSELIELSLSICGDMECLIDNMSGQVSHDKTVFSKLLKLRLFDMEELEALCRGPPPSGLFEKLEELLITHCEHLHSIVSRDMLNLRNLKYLQLRYCANLKYLFTYSTAQTMISLEVLKVKYCHTLEHIIILEGVQDIVSVRTMFPKLKKVSIKECDHMRCIMPASFAGGLSELEILEVKAAAELEYVFGGYNDDIVQNLIIDLPVLKAFKLTALPKIISIAPEHCSISCLSYEVLHLCECPNLSSTSGLHSKASRHSDDEATNQDLGLSTQFSSPMNDPATNMESNLEPEGLPLHYKSSDEQEAIVTVDEERCHPNDAKDEGEKEAGQENEEKYGIPEDNIVEGATSCVESRELDEESMKKQPKDEFQLPIVLEDQQEAQEESEASTYQHSSEGELVGNSSTANHALSSTRASASYQQMLAEDSHETQEDLQEQNLDPVGAVKLREGNTEIAMLSFHKDSAVEQSTVVTSLEVLIDKQPQTLMYPQQALQEYKAPHQEMLPEDSNIEFQGASEFPLHSQNLDAVVDIQRCLQKQHLYDVGCLISRESTTKFVKGSLRKYPAPEESTVGSSSQVALEWWQQVIGEYKGSLSLSVDPTELSPSTNITAETLNSSSTNQHHLAEELVDFHGLFRIKERRASLLQEALVKYPHLWEWRLSKKTPRICKVGYKSLADMLAFLKSETPKTMDALKMEKFENLCYELEYFGFDRIWLASICQRVMDMQADYNNKLKQVGKLESQIGTLEEQLSDARASLASVKDDLSKPGHVFGF